MEQLLLKQLIEKCKQGDGKAQKSLYELFSAKMFAVCLRYANCEDDAKDIMQNGFIKMFRKIEDFRGDGAFEGWLRRIMVTTGIEHYRKKGALQPLQALDDVQEKISDGVTVLDSLQVNELMILFSKLSPGYRTVLNMFAIEGYSHKEIAKSLGISEGASKSQLSRARTVMRDLIKRKEADDYETAKG